MTADEWVTVVQYIQAQWPHSRVPDESLVVWFDDVRDLPADAVMTAVRAIARDGREFPPNGGLVRRRVAELAADAPEWADVFEWVRRYVATGVTNPMYSQSNYVGRDRPDHPAQRARRLLERMTPLAAAFIESMSGRQLAEAFEQDGGGEARLREKWTAWQRRSASEAVLRGLPSAGLPALERINGPVRIGPTVADVAGELAAE